LSSTCSCLLKAFAAVFLGSRICSREEQAIYELDKVLLTRIHYVTDYRLTIVRFLLENSRTSLANGAVAAPTRLAEGPNAAAAARKDMWLFKLL
jgi:hypothetical protein